jgi:vancomycin resistance protein YoaR
MDFSKFKKIKKHHYLHAIRCTFWFLVGAFIAAFLIANLSLFIFQRVYSKTVYPGVIINGVNFGGKTKQDVKIYFNKKNEDIKDTTFVFKSDNGIATVSAKAIDFGYDANLLADQAFLIGRSENFISDASLLTQAYVSGVFLSPSYSFSENKLKEILSPLILSIDKKPIDALFTFENGRVTAFRPSEDGQAVDIEKLKNDLKSKSFSVLSTGKAQSITFEIPIKELKPKVSTDKANNLGIRELIGTGTSLFQHSIPGRIYNVILASSRLNGILVAPGQTLSFNDTLGDVSSFTGYKQAYVIKNGRTVLGDGGGVCQVSTTLFRAVLDSGLPVLERTAHAYRVGYYEQDSPPGLDATVYGPSPDLKFKNDTSNYILIQTVVDPSILRLTFYLYGTKDGRETTLTKPVILSQTPPPPPLYQDDPNLPKGQVQQVDFAAWGANVYFTRQVVKNGKVIISEKFTSNYQPWQDIFLKGTKE